MTLAFWLEVVKRQQVTGYIALACTVVALAGFWVIWEGASVERSRADDYGNALAETLALQGQDAMRKSDHVHLFVLTNRISNLRDVIGAGFYSPDNRPVVESGDMTSAIAGDRLYTSPVPAGEATTGQVRVRLDAGTFTIAGRVGQFVATLLLVLITPLLAMLLHEFVTTRSRQLPILETEVEAEEPALQPRWLVVGNFYNQLSFAGDSRREIRDRLTPKAERVARIYDGHARSVASGSLLLEFDASEDDGFKALCAGWLLNALLAEGDPDVQFRFALHRVMASPAREVRPEILADASLLAALAPDDSLVASHDFMTSLQQPERCTATPLEHPMLADIVSITGPAFCLSALSEPHAGLLRQQVSALLGYSTDIASTR